MEHPKTTWAGIAVILAGVFNVLAQYFQGHPIDSNAVAILIAAISGGFGLIKASDAKTPPTP